MYDVYQLRFSRSIFMLPEEFNTLIVKRFVLRLSCRHRQPMFAHASCIFNWLWYKQILTPVWPFILKHYDRHAALNKLKVDPFQTFNTDKSNVSDPNTLFKPGLAQLLDYWVFIDATTWMVCNERVLCLKMIGLQPMIFWSEV